MSLINSRAAGSMRKISLIAMLAIAGWFSVMSFNKWQNSLSWDLFGYYLYTPATVIWKDPGLKDFSKVEEINAKYHNTPSYYQGSRTEKGTWMIKYTMGAAVMEFPFFVGAHILAPTLGYERDGFSAPYQKAMIFAHFFYVIIGFIFLRKVLLRYFTDRLTAFLMVLIVIGSNYYVTASTCPSIHTMEFTLFSIILYLTIKWHETPNVKFAILLGLTIGLSILVRPTDGLIVLIPLLWNVTSLKTLKEKTGVFFSNYKMQILLAAIFCFLVVFLQMCYWKSVNDTWFIMSYNNNPGEGFEFLHPYLLQVLFSFRKGWFVYTPLMIFAVLGFYQMYKKQKNIFWPLFIFSILNVYVVSSWSCWWYAGCFGQRAMVESYALLIFPLGYFVDGVISSQRKLLKGAALIIVVFIVGLNIFQTWQYNREILDGSRMTAKYYLKIFGKKQAKPEDKKYLLVDRSQTGFEHFNQEDDYKKRILFYDDFESIGDASREQYVDSIFRNGKGSIMLDSNFIYTPKNELPFDLITKKDHAWIRTTFWYLPKVDPKQNPLGLVVTFSNKKGEAYKYSVIDVGGQPGDNVDLGHWNKYVFDYLTPEVRNESDKINIYFWMRGKLPVYIDDFKVEAFEQKDQTN
jgi:hypothetical protein